MKTSVAWILAAIGSMTVSLGAVPAVLANETGPLSLASADTAVSEPVGTSDTMLLAQAESEPEAPPRDVASYEPVDDGSFPISFGLSYAMYTDYIFRFVNFSEYPGEGREKLNHQLTVEIGFDLGDFGAITYGTWFEWYAAQSKLNGSGQNIQEIDYYVDWTVPIDAIATDLSLGVVFYAFPNAESANSWEYYVALAHNDAWMWKWLFPDNEDGVLNPSFAMYHDPDELNGVWMEFAVSHTFELIENLTLTPGMLVAIDANYWEDSTRFAGDQYSMVLEYDVGSALQIPDWAGSLTITGELYFNNPWGQLARSLADDEFWGGMSVNWGWGG
jgi:hypothetical protein